MIGRTPTEARDGRGPAPRRWPWLVAGVPVLAVALLVAAWAVDTSAAGSDVTRNVSLDGMAIGGANEATVRDTVERLAADLRDAPVRIRRGETTLRTTMAELGMTLDIDSTIDAALDVGRNDTAPLRPFLWLASFVRERSAPLRFAVDRVALRDHVADLEGSARRAPIEPAIRATDDGIEVVPGEPGKGILVDALADDLVEAAESGDEVLEVAGRIGDIAPRYTDEDAAALAQEADELARTQLTATVEGETVELPVDLVRSWLRAEATDVALTVGIDPDAAVEGLRTLFPDVGVEPVDATFTVEGGRPVLVPGRTGTACCDPAAAAAILDALRNQRGGIELGLTELPPDVTTEEASSFGIAQEIGRPDEFGPTTRHRCCESRVTNIHRIADLVRGHVVRAGETFSVNQVVGKRTRDKGFVEAGVIYEGRYESDVGGGVSQFATTLFNAALYAGLEIVEYQSHSLYISRYPRGHEATLSWPKPDLVVRNDTPYAVLIWPTYTDTSITVHLYSTPHAEVQLGATTDRRQGNCTRVTTPRTRTYPDGEVKRDSVSATYRPAEGVNC